MLRGINVSGQKTILKADLISLYQSLGFDRIVTYLQSGNVVFNSAESDAENVTAQLEAQIEHQFGFQVTVFVRDAAYFQEILVQNPFFNERPENPAALYVTFLYRSPEPERLAQLAVPQGETAEFSIGKEAVYIFCPDGYGRTKLSNTFFERKLAVPATTRNWNTVNALYQLGKE